MRQVEEEKNSLLFCHNIQKTANNPHCLKEVEPNPYPQKPTGNAMLHKT